MLATPLQPSVAVAVPVLAGKVEAVQSMFPLAGQVIVGPCVSVTVMVWLQVAELPQASIAVQVRVMVMLLAQAPKAFTLQVICRSTSLQSTVVVASATLVVVE